MKSLSLKGVFVASVTPFNENGSVNYPAFETHLRELVAAGVHGFVPCGTTGEGATLNTEEWRELVRLSVAIAREKNLKVVAGCGGNDSRKVAELMLQAADLGADAALVVTPYYNKPTARGLLAHYEFLTRQSELPIVLYNVPGRTNVSLSVDTVAELFQNPQIIGIKEASGQYGQWLALANRLNLREKFLLAGDDDAFAIVQAMGGCGIISAAANVLPTAFVKLWQLMERGEWTAAFQLQVKLFPLVKSLFLETNPAPAKFALSTMKRVENFVRLPLVPVTADTEQSIRASLSGWELG